MSQNVFASFLGIKKKTIEKWEQEKNPIKGAAARLLYVLNNNPRILDYFYKVKKQNIEIDYDLTKTKETVIVNYNPINLKFNTKIEKEYSINTKFYESSSNIVGGI